MFGLGYITGAIGSVYNGAKWVGTKIVEKAGEILEGPIGVIKDIRDSIKNILTSNKESAIDAVTPSVKTGADIDKTAADIAANAKEVVGANKVDVAEGINFAEIRSKWGENLGKASSDLNRYKSENDNLIGEETSIEKDWSTAVTTESGPEALPTPQGDEKFTKEIVSFFNTWRQNEGGGDELKIDKKLSEEAKKRASLILHRGDKNLIPYRYLRTPPITRKNDIVKEGLGLTMYGKYPRFPSDLTQEERERVNKIEWDEKAGTYKAVLNESDQDYAERIRKVKSERDAFEVTNLNFTFDLNDESYPIDSDPRALLYKLSGHDAVKELLLRNMKKIGVGIHREGTKVVMSFFITSEAPPDDAIEAPIVDRPEDYSANEWWMKQIDDKKKTFKRSPQEYSIQELFDRNEAEGKPAYRSGYSLYEYSLFRDEVDNLKSQGLNINLLPVQFQPNEALNDHNYHTLHIPLKVNGHDTMIRLIMGTDIVAAPKTVGDSEAKGGQFNFIPLRDYLEKMKKKSEPIEVIFPAGHAEKKGQVIPFPTKGSEDEKNKNIKIAA